MFVNKEDKPRADFHRVLDQLRAAFGSGFVPLELPLGEEEALHGVADVLTDQGLEYDPDGRHRAEPLPSEVADEEHRLHDELIEEIVTGDDEQLERYLSGDVPTPAELERTLAHEVLDCLEFPVLVGSATTGVGIDRLADFICELGPSPADRPVTVAAGSGSSVRRRDVADAVGQAARLRLQDGRRPVRGSGLPVQGAVGHRRRRRPARQHDGGTEERLHGLFHLRGREHLADNKVVAGDIGGCRQAGGNDDGIDAGAKDSPSASVDRRDARRTSAWRCEPVTQSDDDKLSAALQRLVAEDPASSSTATRRRTRRCCGGSATRTSPSRSSGSPASSGSTSRPRTCGCPTARRSPARPRRRGRSRSSRAVMASSPSPT